MEYGAHLPLIELDAGTFSLARLRTYARHRGRARVHVPLRQRPPALRATVARRANCARGGGRPGGGDDARDHGLPAGDPRAGADGQDARRARRPLRRTARRRRRGRLLRARLRGGRDPVRGALAAVRRGDAGAARAPARRSPARGRDVLLDTGHRARAEAGAAAGASDLGRELGLAPGAPSRRPHRGRLARVGVQHDPRRVPRRALVPRDAAPVRREAGRAGSRTASRPSGSTSPRIAQPPTGFSQTSSHRC